MIEEENLNKGGASHSKGDNSGSSKEKSLKNGISV
jgi:hypothetical protein